MKPLAILKDGMVIGEVSGSSGGSRGHLVGQLFIWGVSGSTGSTMGHLEVSESSGGQWIIWRSVGQIRGQMVTWE